MLKLELYCWTLGPLTLFQLHHILAPIAHGIFAVQIRNKDYLTLHEYASLLFIVLLS